MKAEFCEFEYFLAETSGRVWNFESQSLCSTFTRPVKEDYLAFSYVQAIGQEESDQLQESITQTNWRRSLVSSLALENPHPRADKEKGKWDKQVPKRCLRRAIRTQGSRTDLL
jgi:hypothetical protein